jgi:hypothetical protein
MRAPATLGQRTRLAALVSTLLRTARVQATWTEPDPRSCRTLCHLILAVLTARSTRLVALARPLRRFRRARTVKAVTMSLTYFLREARIALATLAPGLAAAALAQVPPNQIATYRGRALLVLDPTDYPKRSRGEGRCGRGMEHIGRVRTTPTQDSPTTRGYVDVWAGLVLKGKRWLPLARRLFSAAHPDAVSQNQIEAAVLHDALAATDRLGWDVIVIGDRGLGRKEWLVDLAARDQPYVLRLDADILARRPDEGEKQERLLAAILAEEPWHGEVDWDRGQEGVVRCQVRWTQVVVWFSRSGTRRDRHEATIGVVEARPRDPRLDPLILATTLPLASRADVVGIVGVYSQRWAIETAFETMKGWGLGKFMVRSWTAIDRLLWMVALAYALSVLAVLGGGCGWLRRQAVALLAEQGVLGRRLTPGKLAEAIALDFPQHALAWAHAWFT